MDLYFIGIFFCLLIIILEFKQYDNCNLYNNESWQSNAKEISFIPYITKNYSNYQTQILLENGIRGFNKYTWKMYYYLLLHPLENIYCIENSLKIPLLTNQVIIDSKYYKNKNTITFINVDKNLNLNHYKIVNDVINLNSFNKRIRNIYIL